MFSDWSQVELRKNILNPISVRTVSITADGRLDKSDWPSCFIVSEKEKSENTTKNAAKTKHTNHALDKGAYISETSSNPGQPMLKCTG